MNTNINNVTTKDIEECAEHLYSIGYRNSTRNNIRKDFKFTPKDEILLDYICNLLIQYEMEGK